MASKPSETTGVLKALPVKLDISRHPSSTFYVYSIYEFEIVLFPDHTHLLFLLTDK